MKHQNQFLIIVAIILLSGCAVSSPIVIDYDKDADFNAYETYYWSDEFQQANHAENENPLFYNTLNKKRLKSAIEKEMRGRGYVLNAVDPDLLINSRIVVEQKNRTISQNRNPYYSWYYAPDQMTTTTTQKEGGVVIELIDKEEQQLVWQGYASNVLQLSTEDKQAEIRAAVSSIFSRYTHRSDAQ